MGVQRYRASDGGSDTDDAKPAVMQAQDSIDIMSHIVDAVRLLDPINNQKLFQVHIDFILSVHG